MFEMKEDESIDEMYGKLATILNEIRILGKIYNSRKSYKNIKESSKTYGDPWLQQEI